MPNKIHTLFSILLACILLTACAPSPKVDTQATIDAAVQGTQKAQVSTQATINASVKGTLAVQAAQATFTPQPTLDSASLSAEELAAMIDEAVAKSLASAETTYTSVNNATSDGTVTAEETAASYNYTYETTYYAAYAEELIQTYYEYYGAYAEEALQTLQAMEEDLNEISQSMNEISSILEQGAAAANAAIEQLNAAANQAREKATQAQEKLQGFQEKVTDGLGTRENDLLGMKPTEVAANRAGALNQAHDFLDTFKTALSDGKFSPDELTKIGQLSANTRASFDKLGGDLGNLSGAVDKLTRQAARGDLGGARQGMGELERGMPARPKRP